MEFYLELFLTALMSILLAFLVGKLAALGTDDDDLEPATLHDPAISGAGAVRIGENRDRLEAGGPIEGEAQVEYLRSGLIRSSEIVADIEEEGSQMNLSRTAEAGSEIVRSVGEKGSLLHEEDEWEGIERSEIEKLFSAATSYVDSFSGGEAVSRLSSDVQMQLYGLHKVATEGPCYEPQPLALKVSARVKWHAWQRLGNMNPEVAMEHYIEILSQSIPGWVGEKPGSEGNDPPVQGVAGTGTPDSGSSLHSQLK